MITLHYIVEYRHPDTGYWTEEASFKPEYKITTTIQIKCVACFTWEKTVTKCHNQGKAELAERTRALKMAKTLREKDVRVRSCVHFKDYDYWATVWLNGEFKDC